MQGSAYGANCSELGCSSAFFYNRKAAHCSPAPRLTEAVAGMLLQVPLYDLRSPLGVAPAALTHAPQPQAAVPDAHAAPAGHHLLLKAVGALAEAQLPPSLVAAKAFAASRAQLRAKVASSGQVGPCTGVWAAYSC